ncbi:hypothetical protein ACSQ67_014107 [Phaseolus vulgaris]
MSTVNNTVNAAASAIVTAESRVQPATSPKKRWGSCWSLYWCFGPHKNSKRIGNAVLVPEPVEPAGQIGSHLATAAPNPSTAVAMPFIVPPSSPASFLESDSSSATQSPVGLFSLSSLNANASCGPASIFAIGPYTYETQLVSPPVFSNFTTEPSTAPFTPPPESVQLTTPSSPEVPFAQLLTSSLDRDCKDKGTNQREASNLLGFEHFSTHKWNSRLGSGSLTPDSTGQGSGLGSGSLTPNAVKLVSSSGCLTPEGVAPTARNGIYVGKQTSELTPLANSENECQPNAALVDHRVSFELTGEDVARCLANKSGSPLIGNISGSSQGALVGEPVDRERIHKNSDSDCDLCSRKTSNDKPENSPGEGEEQCCLKHNSSSSSKDFNFDSRKGVVSDNPANASEWWTNKKIVGKEGSSSNGSAFFPMLQSEII